MMGRAGSDKRITKFRGRNPKALSLDVLENLKAMRSQGSLDIAGGELADMTGSSVNTFYNQARNGKIQKTKRGRFDLNSVISWMAEGIVVESMRSQGDHGMNVAWMSEDNCY
jgi:hypothetical protein